TAWSAIVRRTGSRSVTITGSGSSGSAISSRMSSNTAGISSWTSNPASRRPSIAGSSQQPSGTSRHQVETSSSVEATPCQRSTDRTAVGRQLLLPGGCCRGGTRAGNECFHDLVSRSRQIGNDVPIGVKGDLPEFSFATLEAEADAPEVAYSLGP